MKSFLLTALCSLIFYSCKPYKQYIDVREGQITYGDFRQDQKSFNSSDGAIAYIDRGTSDKVILLLHGIPTSGWLYRKMIDPLVDQGYRVIAPDMLGFGSSDNPKGYEVYSKENHAKRLLELMDHLNIKTWTHTMHDAGGIWTWELIKKDPTRIKKLVILNTVIYKEGFQPPIKMKKGFFAQTAMWGYRNGVTTNALLEGLFIAGLNDENRANLNKTDIEGYRTPLREGKTRGMYYFFTRSSHGIPNYQTTVQSLDIPVTVVWGNFDDMLVWKDQADQVTKDLKIKTENIHIIDGKHFIQEGFYEDILEAIKSL